MVGSLEKQVNSLRRQAKKAILHRRLRSVIRQLDLSLSLVEYAGLIKDRKVLSHQVKEVEHAHSELEGELRMVSTARFDVA